MKNLFDYQHFSAKKITKNFTETKEEAAPGGTAPKERRESVLVVATMITSTATNRRKPPYKKPQAVKHLEQLADLENQRRHPNTPDKYLAKCKYRDDTYSGLVKCIIDYIRLQGGTAQRLASSRPQDTRQTVRDVIGRKYEIGSVDYRPQSGDTNGADIHAVINGWSVLLAARPGGHCYEDGNMLFFGDFTAFCKWYNQAFGV